MRTHNKPPSHDLPRRYISPQHYPNINNRGTTTPHNSLADEAEEQEAAEEEAEVDEHDLDVAGEHHKDTHLPCNMWEATR